MRILDLSSWQGMLTTLLALAMITLLGVGIRLTLMQTVQRRRERENRQINERLRTLIAAYRTLGGSFTGDLAVDPTHLHDRSETQRPGWDRTRRIRDAVEAALSDIILLGTEDQVRLAATAAAELAEGRSVHTAELVVSLRNFIRHALDLGPVPIDLAIPRQGPARPLASRGRGSAGGAERDSSRQGAARGADGGGMAAGAGMGLGIGGVVASEDEGDGHRHS
jgi:type II secretory pathway pseudopilin PulG